MCCSVAVRMGHLDMDRDTAADYSARENSAISEFADFVGMAEVAVLEFVGSADMVVVVNVVAALVNPAAAVDSDFAREPAALELAGSADMAAAVNVVAVSVNSAVAVDSDSAREPAVLEFAGFADMAAAVSVVAASVNSAVVVVNSAVVVNLVLPLLTEDYLFALAVPVLVDLSMAPVLWMKMRMPMYLSFHLLLHCPCLHFDFLHLSNQH